MSRNHSSTTLTRRLPGLLAVLLPGLLAALLVALALARPWQAAVDVGHLYDSPSLRDFHRAEYSSAHEASFRWSQPEATLVLPGVGRVAPLELRLHGDEAGMPVYLDAGAGPVTVELRPGWQWVMLLPRPDSWSGDVRVAIVAPSQVSADDPRARGVALDWVAISGRGEVLPGQVALLSLSAALLALLTTWAVRRAWAGALAGSALAAGCAWLLTLHDGAWRLWLTDYSGRLLLVLILGGLLAAGFERLLAWLAARNLVRLGPQTRRALAAVALLAFLLRFGGMAYPLNHNSDLPFILGRTWLVREGHLLTLFFPNQALTPVQWELDVTIPRSPFYYIITTPVTLLPGRHGDELGMMAFSSAVDALAVLLAGLLARFAGGSGRAAVLAALLAATLPFALMIIVSWGIFPTLLAQCLALLVVLAWLHLRPCLHERRAWLLLAACFALAFLSYPTALAFLGTTWVLLLALLALRRDPATLPTLGAGVLALAVVTLLYYGWHLPAALGETLPTLLGELGGGAAGTEASRPIEITLQRTLDALWLQPFLKYGPLVLALAGGGALLLAARRPTGSVAGTRLWLLAWGLAYIPFALADEYIVTLILKQLVHLLPLLALLGGLLLGRLARSRAGAFVVYAVVALIFWQGIHMELDVIVSAFTQLK